MVNRTELKRNLLVKLSNQLSTDKQYHVEGDWIAQTLRHFSTALDDIMGGKPLLAQHERYDENAIVVTPPETIISSNMLKQELKELNQMLHDEKIHMRLQFPSVFVYNVDSNGTLINDTIREYMRTTSTLELFDQISVAKKTIEMMRAKTKP